MKALDVEIMHGSPLPADRLEDYAVFRNVVYHQCSMIAKGGNGFVMRLEFKHENAVSHVVLKTALKKSSDNATYEYLVGQHVNLLSLLYPCFIKTLGLFRYHTVQAMETVANAKVITERMLHTLSAVPASISASCVNPTRQALMLEDVYAGVTLRDAMTPEFVTADMPFLLFILYHTLAHESSTFTHYDLHDHNVLVYEPFPASLLNMTSSKVVEYHYHVEGEEVVFTSRFIPKVIDYGRCYFKGEGTGSARIRTEVCKTKACKKVSSCGRHVGYKNVTIRKRDHLIRSSLKNESQDLRLLHILREVLEDEFEDHAMLPMLRRVVFGAGYESPDATYVTEENLSDAPDHIYHVRRAYQELLAYVRTHPTTNTKPVGSRVHVYSDGTPMVVEYS